MMFRALMNSTAWLALVGLLLGSLSQATADEVLTIGSDAPEIDVEHWVQNGNGKFKPVTKFAKGKVYVVEFWATWCGPCIASMPHLAELQKKYADKAQIISISDEDLETVETFLKREVRKGSEDAEDEAKEGKEKDEEAKPQTYKMLTSAYCLTTDPDQSAYTSYMTAAGQGGIPTAFIVGKDSKIEWIGHPMEMDEPLEQIVAGTWDREKFGEEFKEKQRLELVMAEVSTAMRTGDAKTALAKIDTAIAESKDAEVKERLSLIRLQIQLNDPDSADQLPAILTKAYEKYGKDPQMINQIAWVVSQKIEAGQLESKEVLKATRKAVEKIANVGDGDTRASILDTVAHIQYLDGDIDAAIKTQTEAVKLVSPQLKDQLQEFLDTLKQAKEEAAEKKADKSEKAPAKEEKKPAKGEK